MAEITLRGVCLAPERPAVIVPLFARTVEELTAQAEAAQAADCADVVELRLDPLPSDQYSSVVERMRTILQKPLLVTLRTAREGGEQALTPARYAELLAPLLRDARFDAVDLEYSAGEKILRPLQNAAKARGLVCVYSCHHFFDTPPTEEMTAVLTGMADAGADIAKLAVMPKTVADAARLLQATAEAAAARPDTPLITMSMGGLGEITRFCGGRFGSVASFGSLTASSAPGQPDAPRLACVLDALRGENPPFVPSMG